MLPTFSRVIATALMAIASTSTADDQFAKSRLVADQARGIIELSRMLLSAPEDINKRCFASVENAVSAPASEIPDRPLADSKKKNVVESPVRVSFILSSADFGAFFPEGPQIAIEWERDYAAHIRVGHGYHDPRLPVLPNPFSTGNLLTFTVTKSEQGADEISNAWVLSNNSIHNIKQTIQWRTDESTLFSPDAVNDEAALTTLRATIGIGNPLQRMVALMQLSELKKLADVDIDAIIQAAQSLEEYAAASFFIINNEPARQAQLLDAINSFSLNSMAMDGVAVGAAMHFLGQSNTDTLVGYARADEFFDAPRANDALLKTISFPVLQHLGKKFQTAIKSGQERQGILYQILSTTGALSN